VGLKTTRIRSLGGEQIVMANAEMIGSTIQNYKKLQERRIVFKFGLTYASQPKQIRQVTAALKDIIQRQDKTRFDRAHLLAFGDSSLDFEVVYIVLDASYNLYMDIQQAINLEMMEAFAKIGVRFALSSRSLYVESLPGDFMAERDRQEENESVGQHRPVIQ